MIVNSGQPKTVEKNLSHSHVDSGSHQSGLSCFDRSLAFVVWS